MTTFKGFLESETFTRFPNAFFHQLIKEITDLDELKVILYALWRFENTPGTLHTLRHDDLDGSRLGLDADEIHSGLEKSVGRGTLLKADHAGEMRYFLNSPRGRAAAESFSQGKLDEVNGIISAAPVERPNIFALYEENIGPLTPLLADMLKDAEQTYKLELIEEAFLIAVRENKRNWKYIEAILKRWKDEGSAKKQARRDVKKSRQRDVEDKIKKFIDG